MPTYEYRCDDCGHHFETFQKITDDPLDACPECGKGVQRLIGATNFILKGGGWYKSDYSPPSGDAVDKAPCSPDKDSPACQGCPSAKTD